MDRRADINGTMYLKKRVSDMHNRLFKFVTKLLMLRTEVRTDIRWYKMSNTAN